MLETTVDISDKSLVIRLINSDEEAFSELYAKYKNRLYYFAIKFLKSSEYAEDVYQDAFTAIWQTRHFLDPEKSFSSYLYTIIKNRILNILKNIEQDQKLCAHILSHAVDCTNETDNPLYLKELNGIVEKALGQLTPRQKQVFEMSRNNEMSHNEIAKTLNISIYTVQEHISLAIKNIRDYLRKYPDHVGDLLLLLICLNL